MPLTQSQRNQISNFKVRIESVRKDLQRLKDDKKRKSEYYRTMKKTQKTRTANVLIDKVKSMLLTQLSIKWSLKRKKLND